MEVFERAYVRDALAFALSQVRNRLDRKLAVEEFWHSMNRKGLVENGDVQWQIDFTLKVVELFLNR